MGCRLPVAGPDGMLYLSLEPASEGRGGSLDAIGKDGRRPAGWPVELSRAGSKVWDVAVGEDGTVVALAVEPEVEVGLAKGWLAAGSSRDDRRAG